MHGTNLIHMDGVMDLRPAKLPTITTGRRKNRYSFHLFTLPPETAPFFPKHNYARSWQNLYTVPFDVGTLKEPLVRIMIN